MDKIVCPKCGALNFRGFLTYPVCHQCHENLTRCGYCQHFPGDDVPCPHFDPASPVATDSVRPCETFERVVLTAVSPLQRRPLRAALWASLFTGTLLGLLAVAASLLAPRRERPQVRWTVDVPRRVRLGQEFTARLTLHNDADSRTERLKIRAANDLFQTFRCEQVDPAATPVVSGNYRYYRLPKLPPRKRLDVAFVLAALEGGRHQLRLEVLTQSNERQGEPLSRFIEVLPQVAQGGGSLEETHRQWSHPCPPSRLATPRSSAELRVGTPRVTDRSFRALNSEIRILNGGLRCLPKTNSWP